VACAADVADHWGVPAWLHTADRELLSDTGPGLPSSLELARQFGVRLREPEQLRLLDGGETLSVGGLNFEVIAAPGHRPGCVMFATASTGGEAGEPAASPLLFSGDVLFAGSIGRTDLPGGDPAAMAGSLRDVVLGLPDDWVVLSGHGPETTIGAERATNPYLQDRFLRNL
jgi:glyoxylase-like metal-dependent hydrolase (beta-lactamase superfamily II)